MLLITLEALPCPTCQQPLKPQQLIKQPYRGKLPWYGITPAPTQHCPKCHSALYLTGWHKGWLIFAIISIIVAFVTHIFPYRGDLTITQQLLLIIPTFSLILTAATAILLIAQAVHCVSGCLCANGISHLQKLPMIYKLTLNSKEAERHYAHFLHHPSSQSTTMMQSNHITYG